MHDTTVLHAHAATCAACGTRDALDLSRYGGDYCGTCADSLDRWTALQRSLARAVREWANGQGLTVPEAAEHLRDLTAASPDTLWSLMEPPHMAA